MSKVLLGADAKALIGAAILAAIAAAGDITGAAVVGNIVDVDLDMDADTVDTSTRETAATGWGTQQTTIKKASVKFDMKWKSGDANFSKIRTAFLTNAEIFMAFLDQDSANPGAQGIAGNWNVSKFGKSEKLKDAQGVSVELVLSSYPSWYVKA